jgi:membrane-bound metal-dependent hydrolase YbcI (DUF457 family)
MPSPIGHALAGVAAGFLIRRVGSAPVYSSQPTGLAMQHLLLDRRLIVFALLGTLPDIDFLFGLHSAYTHSVGAIVVVAAVACLRARKDGAAVVLALASAYGSHVLLDWLGSDTVAPLGVMALWPISNDFFLSDRRWFMSVCREFWLLSCWWHNALGVTREILVLGPLAFGAVYLESRRTTR